MKLIAKGSVVYGKGQIAAPGTLFEVKDETALVLIKGGYAVKYEAPKTAEEIKREKATAAAPKANAPEGDL